MNIKSLYLPLFLLPLFVLGVTKTTEAQRGRFINGYPVTQPSSSKEYKEEYDKTVSAILGGVQLLESPNLPKNRDDPEAYIEDDYQAMAVAMVEYAKKMCEKTGAKYTKDLDKIGKMVDGGRYAPASAKLMKIGAKGGKESERLFFIWNDYLKDIEANMPWVDPKNAKYARMYRAMLQYVSQNYDRPFGVQAETGAVVADAAQALSNCLETPKELNWKGEKNVKMRQEDQLRRLVSNVAYYNWRLHDRLSGQRAYRIDRKIVRHLQKALFDVVKTTMQKGNGWHGDPVHGNNLLKLYKATLANGWLVDGNRAQRRKD